MDNWVDMGFVIKLGYRFVVIKVVVFFFMFLFYVCCYVVK